MKLGYECWSQGCTLDQLVLSAISKTLDEKKALTISNVQNVAFSDHSLMGPSEGDGTPAYSEKQSKRRKIQKEIASHILELQRGMKYEDL